MKHDLPLLLWSARAWNPSLFSHILRSLWGNNLIPPNAQAAASSTNYEDLVWFQCEVPLELPGVLRNSLSNKFVAETLLMVRGIHKRPYANLHCPWIYYAFKKMFHDCSGPSWDLCVTLDDNTVPGFWAMHSADGKRINSWQHLSGSLNKLQHDSVGFSLRRSFEASST